MWEPNLVRTSDHITWIFPSLVLGIALSKSGYSMQYHVPYGSGAALKPCYLLLYSFLRYNKVSRLLCCRHRCISFRFRRGVFVFDLVYDKVRYDPNSQFNEHGHPDGEEILVLEGAWQGEFGSLSWHMYGYTLEESRRTP